MTDPRSSDRDVEQGGQANARAFLRLPQPGTSRRNANLARLAAVGVGRASALAACTFPVFVVRWVGDEGDPRTETFTKVSNAFLGLAASATVAHVVARRVANHYVRIGEAHADAETDRPVVDVLKRLVDSAPADRKEKVRKALAADWLSLRSHFHALAGTDFPARKRAAAELADKDELNALVGLDEAWLSGDAASQSDAAQAAMELIQGMNDILNEAAAESPLTNQQYMDVCGRLNELVHATPQQTFWFLQTLKEPPDPAKGGSSALRLAAKLLQNAGCDYGSMKDALMRAESESPHVDEGEQPGDGDIGQHPLYPPASSPADGA